MQHDMLEDCSLGVVHKFEYRERRSDRIFMHQKYVVIKITENTAVGIRDADYVTSSIRRSWH
jgi:hypothetical protein